jgi:hypothetical protein
VVLIALMYAAMKGEKAAVELLLQLRIPP